MKPVTPPSLLRAIPKKLGPPLQAAAHTVLFVLVWLVLLGGCTSWKTVPGVGPGSTPDVRVTFHSGETLELDDVHVEADTLYGSVPGVLTGTSWSRGRDTAIPMAEVVKLEEKQISHAKTAGLVMLTSVVVFGIAVVIAAEKAN